MKFRLGWYIALECLVSLWKVYLLQVSGFDYMLIGTVIAFEAAIFALEMNARDIFMRCLMVFIPTVRSVAVDSKLTFFLHFYLGPLNL